MKNNQFAFGKENFILLAISIAIIIIGFILLSGGQTTEETGFDPSIFDARRIFVAPVVIMIGFFSVIYAILKKPKDKTNE
ncbi:MAG: DUF3098 domain-containing protein [Bacteroidales bacterium]|nr:DUF3098 domain-containing protein [Bacteroidales bacterium]